MKITDKMIDAAMQAFDDHSSISISNYRDDMKAAIEAAMQAAWISVEDRMPDEYDDVIIKDDIDEYQTSYLRHGKWVVDVGHNDVTHWMPLPEYKGE